MNPTVLCPTTRKQFKQHASVLEDWLVANDNVYPSKEQKLQLASVASMSEHQVNRWFANRRRKLKVVDGSSAVNRDSKPQVEEKRAGETQEEKRSSDIPASDVLADWKFPSTDPNNNPPKSVTPELLLKEQLEKSLVESYLRNAFLAQLLAPQLDSGPSPYLLPPSWPYLQLLTGQLPFGANPFGPQLPYGHQPQMNHSYSDELPYPTDRKQCETPELRKSADITDGDEKESDLVTKETIAVAVLASFALQRKSLDHYE